MISLRHLMHYTDQLSLSVRSGLPIMQIMDHLSRSATSRRLRAISKGLGEEIRSGSSLGGAFAKYRRDFPEMFIRLMDVGERTGHIEEVTARLAEFYRDRYKMMSTMKWRLFLIVLYAFALVNVVIFIYYVFAGWDDRVLLNAYLDLAIVVIFFVLLPYVLYKNFPVFRSAVQFVFHSLPFLGNALRKLCVSRFASGMALGLKAGNEIRDTIRFSSASMENRMLERKALRAVAFIDQGDTIGQSLVKTGVFPTLISQMYITGEESGRLFEMMDHIAEITREQAENALKTITTVFVFLVYLVLILGVGYIIISIWMSIIGSITSIGV